MNDKNRLLLLSKPHVRLSGSIDDAMYESFQTQLQAAPGEGPISIAISSLGGDPDTARRMGADIRLLREQDGRELLFLGKIAVYSAGATFMADFPVENRYLTRSTRIMVHERALDRSLDLSGPLRSARTKARQVLEEIEQSMEIENEGFRAIVKGSKVDFDTIRKKARTSWYIEAEEAKELGLVADVI